MHITRRHLIALTVSVTALAAVALPATPALASPTWLAAFDFTATGGAALEQEAAFDGHDEAFAIWRRREGLKGNFVVQVAIRQPGGLTAVQNLSDSSQSAYEPQIAVNDNGDAVAAWSRTDGSHARIEGAIRPAGGSFGAPQVLSPAGAGARAPQVAIDGQGEATVVWERNDDAPLSGSMVQTAIRPPGGSFGAAKTLCGPIANVYCNWQDVAVDAHGDAVATWARGPFPSPLGIQAAFRGPGQDFGNPQSVTSPVTTTSRNPHVAVAENGAALLEWAQAPNGGNVDVLQIATRPPGGQFGAATAISRANEDANTNDMAMNRHGDAVVIWESIVGNALRIEATRRTGDGAFGPVQEVTDTTGNQQLPRAAVDDQANALAVWRKTVNGKDVIQGASADAGNPFGAPTPLSHADQTANNPAVALSPRGDGLAVWQSTTTNVDVLVQGAGFDRTAPTLSGLSVPGSATEGQPVPFAVTATDVWSPTQIAWDFGDGTTAAGGSPQHAFAHAGSYPIKVTATDAVGNSTTSNPSSVAVTAPQTALTLSGVTLQSRRFLVAAKTARATRRARIARGTAFRYSVSEKATLSIALQRALPGRRSGRRCVAPSKKLSRAKRCIRYISAGRLAHISHAGRNSLPFSGKVGRRALRPGAYRAVLRATAGGKRSRQLILSFVILRG